MTVFRKGIEEALHPGTYDGEGRVMGQDTGVKDSFGDEMMSDVAANLIVVHGDAAVFIRFSVEQDHRAGNMDGIEIIHILIGHVRDDDAIEEFILHGFELFLELVNLYGTTVK